MRVHYASGVQQAGSGHLKGCWGNGCRSVACQRVRRWPLTVKGCGASTVISCPRGASGGGVRPSGWDRGGTAGGGGEEERVGRRSGSAGAVGPERSGGNRRCPVHPAGGVPADRGSRGHYFLAVKHNQPTLLEDITAVWDGAPAWDGAPPAPPQAVQIGQHGGRVEQRRLWASDLLVGYSDWPHLAQVCKIERIVRKKNVTGREVAYAVTSLPPQEADAGRLLALWRGHWGIENRCNLRCTGRYALHLKTAPKCARANLRTRSWRPRAMTIGHQCAAISSPTTSLLLPARIAPLSRAPIMSDSLERSSPPG